MKQALFVAWRSSDPNNPGWGPIGRLEHSDAGYRFWYTRGAKELSGFVPFPQMDRIDEVYESSELFPLFANRLLSSKRPEYEAYLRWGGFDAVEPPEPLVILGRTEGRRQTDAIEVFPCPTPDDQGCYLNRFFLHGIEWISPTAIQRIAKLNANEVLRPMIDLCNQHDSFAVAVRTETERSLIGYVPRYLAFDMHRLLYDCEPDYIEMTVDRLNSDAPLQQRVLCRMKSCWPDGFRPCNDELFRPIPTDVPVNC